ncbi:MAG: metallophosphatase domain-containing protein [Halothece sp.]
MKIVVISDTHNRYQELTIPECDVLIHAGDISHAGEIQILDDFVKWARSQRVKETVFIGGNHDSTLQTSTYIQEQINSLPDIHYLEDSELKLFGFKFYGSPWQPRYKDMAFNLDRNSNELDQAWQKIPEDVDVLITHTPPYGILDKLEDERGGFNAGCERLADRLKQVPAKIHAFGHVHEARGVRCEKNTTYVNASVYSKNDQRKVRGPMLFEVNQTGVSLLN